MKGLPLAVRDEVSKAREYALLAVETYNRPGTVFRSGAYIVLMIIAWTALFHAIFLRNRVRPFYRKVSRDRYVRYEKIDGQNKAWELTECLSHFYKDYNPPVRENLKFFIGLRNMIEHRSLPQLDDRIFGECQALLLNFESLLSEQFGERNSLNDSLAVSLQFSAITPAGKAKAIRRLQVKAYATVADYVESFRMSLSSDVYQSMDYSYRVFLLPKTGNHATSSELAIEFINVNDLDVASRGQYERAVTLLKTREVAVINPGGLMPSAVAEKVRLRLGRSFKTNDHTRCWKHFNVRPSRGASDPAKSQGQYCHYDVTHRDYVYTDEWVEFLVSKLADPATYALVLSQRSPPPA